MSVKLLATVKTGFTKKVEEVNKYPRVTINETIKGIRFLLVFTKCLMTKSSIKVEINSLIQCNDRCGEK